MNKEDKFIQNFEMHTPTILANSANHKCHKEAHDYSKGEVDETLVEDTRQEILQHYGVKSKENVFNFEKENNRIGRELSNIRNVRVFIILESKTNPEEKYYADGHTAHAELLDLILKKISESTGKTINRNMALDDKDWDNKWKIKKGIIDPYENNFRDFPKINSVLRDIIIKNKGNNGLTASETEKIEKNPDSKLPNWFRSN